MFRASTEILEFQLPNTDKSNVFKSMFKQNEIVQSSSIAGH